MKHDPVTGAPDFYRFARDYLHTYLPTVARRSPNTIEAYRISLECFLHYLAEHEHIDRANVSFAHFDRPHLKGWLAWMTDERHYAPRTIALRLTTVKAFLTYCSAEDITLVALSQAAKALRAPASARKRIEYLTQPETRAVLAAYTGRTAKSRRNRMLLILLYDTAARVGEITSLTLQDLRLGKPGHVILTGKRNKTRIAPLTGKTIQHLDLYLAEFHPDTRQLPASQPVFYSLRNGKPTALSSDTVSAVLTQAGYDRAADLPLDPGGRPLPHAAQDQGHGPLPAGHPVADHHAAARPREHVDHSGVLRLRHRRHDAASRGSSHPRDRLANHAAAHRGQAPDPIQPQMTAVVKPRNQTGNPLQRRPSSGSSA
jgi:site-specific recombinase XerD